MNLPEGYVAIGDAIDKDKVRRVQEVFVRTMNDEDVSPVEGVVILNTMLMSLAQVIEPEHRWQLRADFIAMVLRAGVRQDAQIDLFNEPAAVQ